MLVLVLCASLPSCNLNIGSETDKYANIISAANNYTVGLQKDGTVLSTTFSIDTIQDIPINQVKDWIDIIAVSAGSFHTVGLKKDGTVISTASINEYDYGQTDVSGWTDIVAVSAGTYHTVGLKKDGSVVSTRIKSLEEIMEQSNNFSDSDIVSFTADTLKKSAPRTGDSMGDGTVGQDNIAGWANTSAISAGKYQTIGVKKDGTVVSTKIINKEFDIGQTNVESWKLF